MSGWEPLWERQRIPEMSSDSTLVLTGLRHILRWEKIEAGGSLDGLAHS